MSTFEIVSFNDIVITDLYTVLGSVRPPAGVVNSTQEVSGYDGVKITGSYIPSDSITLYILLKNMSLAERREEIRRLRGLLHTEGLAKLKFSTDNGLYYMAKLDGDFGVTQHVRADLITVTFILEQNILYGKIHTVTVPSGGSVTFHVDGTYKSNPVISGRVSADSSTLLWGVRLDEQDYVRIKTGSTEPRDVVIDCENYVASVSGTTAMLTLNSDWLELKNGEHTITNDVGSGSCTVIWQDRWL